jgi:hypothetical protein
MKIVRNILFGVIYTVIYFFLALMSTGGGHGNFFLLAPLMSWILNFVALILLTRLESLLARIFFVVSMLLQYLITLLILLNVKDHIVEDWNRVAGREGIYVTVSFYLLGQIIIWLLFFKSIRNQQTLK